MPTFWFVIVLFILAVVLNRHRSKKADTTWSSVARRSGLQYSKPGVFGRRVITGEVGGFATKVDSISRGSHKNRRTFTRWRLWFPQSLGMGLQLTREGFLSGFAKAFGSQDLQVGDANFDQDVMVKARSGKVHEFLTPSRRFHIHRFLTGGGRRKITDSGIELERRGLERDPARLRSYLALMADLAGHLVGPADDGGYLSKAIGAQESGDLTGALKSLQSAPKPDAASRVLEGEILYVGQRYEEAEQAFDQAAQQRPDDLEAEAWRDRAHARAAGQEPPPIPKELVEPVADVPPPPLPDVVADAAAAPALCEALFGAGVSSLETNRIFEDTYQDEKVSWRGIISSVDRSSFDLVFGNEPFTKVVIDVHDVAKDGLLSRMVHAVIKMPEDEQEALESREGEEVAFTGTLTRCDPFMRNLFIADGGLVNSPG
ncbi:MAG: hypothetical protein CMJ83_13985 [Planctomycetes bacterium]|nr:hypothetical protein [Planctomycetota bacterium]